MFVVHEELQVTGGRQQEAKERLAGGHQLMGKHGGFSSAYVLRFLGGPGKHLALRFWKDRASQEAWGRSEDLQAYLKARPEGLYTTPPQIEYYETVAEAEGKQKSEAAGHAIHIEYHVAGGKQQDFEKREADFYSLLVEAPGCVNVRLLKFRGDPSKYIRVATWLKSEDREAFTRSDPYREFNQSAPNTVFLSAPSIAEVLRRLGRALR